VGEFRSQEERGGNSVDRAGNQLLERGRRALAAVAPTAVRARIDFVREAAGDFEVMELN
jgi:hypothetical protein